MSRFSFVSRGKLKKSKGNTALLTLNMHVILNIKIKKKNPRDTDVLWSTAVVLSCVPQSLGLRQHIRRHQGEWGRGWEAAGDLSWGSVYLSKEFLNYVCAIRSKPCAKNWEYDGDKVRHSVCPQELTEISTGHSCSQLSRSHFLLQCSGRFRPILQLVRFCLSIPAPLLPPGWGLPWAFPSIRPAEFWPPPSTFWNTR